jgi:YidC/Oxa1 family membrane protein insertase
MRDKSAVMDTQRLVLFVIFSFSALLLWEAWQKEMRPPTPPTVATQQQQGKAAPAGDLPRRLRRHPQRRRRALRHRALAPRAPFRRRPPRQTVRPERQAS